MVRNVTIQLTEPLATEAERGGLLCSEVLERLLRAEVRRQRAAQLMEAADRLAEVSEPLLTPGEIDAEIQAVRVEKRGANASRP